MIVKACCITNTGKIRMKNEDSLLLNELLISETGMDKIRCLSSADQKRIYIVADGMGGHAKGEVASRTVLSVFKEGYKEAESIDDIKETILSSKRRLNGLVEADKSRYGMGTTVTGILMINGKGIIFNCGDSRVYGIKDGFLEKLTWDHSIVQALVDGGIITEDEMRRHPQKHLMTSSVMGDLRSELPEVFFREIDIRDGDKFLLCSDGLWESVDTRGIRECYSQGNLEEAVQCLFEKTMAYGAPDNVTIIGLEIKDGCPGMQSKK